MNGTENKTARSRWRDFVNRREPAALRVLGLLVLLALGQIVWLAVGGHSHARVLSLLLTVAVIVLNSWCSLPSSPAFPDPRWAVPASARRWVWFVTAVAALLALWPRSARLNHPLTRGEIAQWRGEFFGERDRNDDPARSAHLHWDDESRIEYGSGHGPWSRWESRLGHLMSAESPDKPVPFNERALRTLPWIGGVLTVGFLCLLGAALGSPRAGLGAALILAMHPQHIRWSSEIGGISTMMLSLTAALLCLLQALQSNQWRWWLGLAAAQAICLLCHSGALPACTAMNVMAAFVIWKCPAAPRDRHSHFVRLVLAAAVAVIPFLSVPGRLEQSYVSPPDTLSHALSGVSAHGRGGSLDGKFDPTTISDPSVVDEIRRDIEQSGMGLRSIAAQSSWRGVCLYVILPILAAGGLFFLLRQDWRTRLVAGSLTGAVAATWAGWTHTATVACMVLLLVLSLAWAGDGLARRFPRQRRLIHAPLFAAMIYVVSTMPALQRLMSVPIQPLRSVLATIDSIVKKSPEALSVTFGSSGGDAEKVDWQVRRIDSLQSLNSLIDTAYERKLPLFIYHTLADSSDPEWRPITDELEKGGRFQFIKEFPAFEPGNSYRLYRYQPREQIIRLNLKPEEK